MIRLDPDTLRDEIDQVLAILNELKEKIDSPLPETETPAQSEHVDIFEMRLIASIQLVSERMAALAGVLLE